MENNFISSIDNDEECVMYSKSDNIEIIISNEADEDSPDWIKNKQVTINRINKKDNKCFQYAVTVVLSYEEIKKDPQRITKIKPFINKYNWEGTNFPKR